jgi:hypothetical protein
MLSFDEWFKRATGYDPFSRSSRSATGSVIPELVDVPRSVGLEINEGD